MRALCHAKLLQMQVIIEDSEMLAYGCPRFLFKMDKDCVCMNQAHPCRVLASAHKTPGMPTSQRRKDFGSPAASKSSLRVSSLRKPC